MLLLGDGLQDVTGAGDLGKVELGLDLRLGGTAGGALFGGRGALPLRSKELPYPFRFVDLDGARVGLLFRDADLGKHVEDGLRLDFEFPRQIVDTNLLLHPPRYSSDFVPLVHKVLTVLVG